MRSRARVRFSKNCLISCAPRGEYDENQDDSGRHDDGYLMLNFRLVRESYTQVRDSHIHVQARYNTAESGEDTKTSAWQCGGVRPSDAPRERLLCTESVGSVREAKERRAELGLEADVMSTLDFWHVIHKIDEGSPLWPLRDTLEQHLQSIEISLTAYDPYFSQPVRLYTRCVQSKTDRAPPPLVHLSRMMRDDRSCLPSTLNASRLSRPPDRWPFHATDTPSTKSCTVATSSRWSSPPRTAPSPLSTTPSLTRTSRTRTSGRKRSVTRSPACKWLVRGSCAERATGPLTTWSHRPLFKMGHLLRLDFGRAL